MNIRETDIKYRGNGRSEIRRMTSGTMNDEYAGYNPAEWTYKNNKGRTKGTEKENARGVSLGRDICYFIKKDAEMTSPYICLIIVSPFII